MLRIAKGSETPKNLVRDFKSLRFWDFWARFCFKILNVFHNYIASYNINAKQKHPGCKKVQGQSEAALQTGATKNFDIG